MPKKIIALKPNVNVRRGMNIGASILGSLRNGEQLDMLGAPMQGRNATEQWAQVIWPADLSATAYACLKLADGTEMCRVVEAPEVSIDFVRGYNTAVQDMQDMLGKLRK